MGTYWANCSLLVSNALKVACWFTVAIAVLTVRAQITFDAPCPNVNVVPNFDLQKYSGVWFEIESYPSLIDEFDVCVFLNYTVITDDTLQVTSSWFNISSNLRESVQGIARLVNQKLGAKLLITFPSSSAQFAPNDGNLWVLETDYTHYAIIFLCVPLNQNSSLHFLSHLSRDRLPFSTGLEFVRQRIDSLGLDKNFLQANDQNSCPAPQDN